MKFVGVNWTWDTLDRARLEVYATFPHAKMVIEVDGGFMIFNSLDDYQDWLNTK